jgi:hypothetical protein
MNRDGNIWVGRAHGLGKKNQMLLVYGYAERFPELKLPANMSAISGGVTL